MRIPSVTQSRVKVRPHLSLHPRRTLHMKVFAGDPITVKLDRLPRTMEFASGVWKSTLIPLRVILNHPNFWPSFWICSTCFLTYKLAFRTQNRLIEAIRKLKLNQPSNPLTIPPVDDGWVEFLKPRLRVLFFLLLLLFIGKSGLHLLEKTLRFPATKAMQHLIRWCFTFFLLSCLLLCHHQE